MEELDKRSKVLIEELYLKIKAFLEPYYNVENVLDLSKRNSTKLVFEDKKVAISMIKNEIQDFSYENNLNINAVKEYLLQLLEKDINSEKPFKEEYKTVKEIVFMDEEER